MTTDNQITTDCYLNDYLTDEDRKVYFPCSLPMRTQVELKHRFGKKVIHKEVLNLYPTDMYNGCRVYGEFGMSELKVLLSVNNKVVVSEIELYWDSVENKTKLGMRVNQVYYGIVSIDGKDPMYFAPHLELLGIE